MLNNLVQISAWSYSRFSEYAKCPALAKYKVIDKLKEPGSPAMDKGNRTHAIAAAFTTQIVPKKDKDNYQFHSDLVAVAKAKKIPAELANYEDHFFKIRKAHALVEENWAFDKNWERTDWFAKDAWCRIKVDCHYLTAKKLRGGLQETTVEIEDYKTGKWSDTHELQRSLYALGALLIYPDAVLVRASHIYLDNPGKPEVSTFGPGNLEKLKAEWEKRTKAMLNDKTFAPKPGPHCRWCHFRKANAGPCVY